MQDPNPARAILCGNLQEKWRTRSPRSTFCARLCSNAHGHVTRGILCGNLQEKCRTWIPHTAFCARLRSRNAHEHFVRAIFAVIYRKKCHTLLRPPRLNTGPLTLTVRTPSVWPLCLGKYRENEKVPLQELIIHPTSPALSFDLICSPYHPACIHLLEIPLKAPFPGLQWCIRVLAWVTTRAGWRVLWKDDGRVQLWPLCARCCVTGLKRWHRVRHSLNMLLSSSSSKFCENLTFGEIQTHQIWNSLEVPSTLGSCPCFWCWHA